MKVAAYITAYGIAAVYKCIQAISKQSYQVIAVLVLDNSPVSIIQYDSIVVSHHPENIGIGEGLMIGIRWAIKGYEFLWVFDQDSVPAPNCLETGRSI